MQVKYLKFFVPMLALLLAVAAFSGVAQAVGPQGDYGSGISCINLSTTTTTATITYYRADGQVATSESNPNFAPGAPWLRFTPNVPGLGSGFLGSAVVSSGEPAGCSVNTQTTTGTRRVGTGEGIPSDKTGPKQYATQVVNALGGFNSYVSIQNAGDASVTVNVKYLNTSGAQVATDSATIAKNASHVFYQDDGKLPGNFIGSAIFEAADGTTPLAGAVALYNSNSAQLLSFNTFSDGANKVFLPRVAKNLSGVGYTSGWSCQNIGPGNADMTMQVTFLDQANGNAVVSATLTKTGVGVGQAWAGYLGAATGTALDGITKGYGSAIVTSTGGKIACTANEDNRTGGGVNGALIGQGSTYGGVPDGEQSNKMSFPQIVALGDNSFQGGFQIANTTGDNTSCTYTFSNGDVVNASLAPNSSNSVFARNALINNKTNFNGSVVVECGKPIVGIYNLTVQGAAAAGDPFATNNGINQ